jgi:hypothetical protein|tara:strand:+ start:148 stop:585 length:438 start_codon:yes stop_codon:yes gene_type:complete
MSQSATDELKASVDIVEETYEFCLAYAAKGVTAYMARTADTQAREQLEQLERALPGLGDVFLKVVEDFPEDGRDQYTGFIEVLRRDAESGRAAVQLVLAQKNITSQMVDNLNGMIHLRALLTDVFLIDEMLRPEADQPLHIQPAE